MDLESYLNDTPVALDTIAAALNTKTHAQRVTAVVNLPRGRFKDLFEAAATSAPLTPNDIVPQHNHSTIMYEGINNLPLLNHFQKEMVRTGDGIIGRNVNAVSFATGPGYFYVQQGHNTELVFDYTKIPQNVPVHWPAPRSNAVGISYFVYRGLLDIMRRVSDHVIIGWVHRNGKPTNNYFVLLNPGEHLT